MRHEEHVIQIQTSGQGALRVQCKSCRKVSSTEQRDNKLCLKWPFLLMGFLHPWSTAVTGRERRASSRTAPESLVSWTFLPLSLFSLLTESPWSPCPTHSNSSAGLKIEGSFSVFSQRGLRWVSCLCRGSGAFLPHTHQRVNTFTIRESNKQLFYEVVKKHSAESSTSYHNKAFQCLLLSAPSTCLILSSS